MGGQHLNAPVVGMAASSDGGGYWLVGIRRRGLQLRGRARSSGRPAGCTSNAPVVGIAATPDDGGYWLAGSDGGVFTYGDAAYLGSVPGQGIVGQPPVVGISPDAERVWVLAGGRERRRLHLRRRRVLGSAEDEQARRSRVGHRLMSLSTQTKSEPPSALTQAPVT